MIPEQRLWQSVVIRALLDATAENPASVDGVRAKRDAHSWLTTGGLDFRRVCDLAGFSPEFINERYSSGQIDGDLLRSSEKIKMARTA